MIKGEDKNGILLHDFLEKNAVLMEHTNNKDIFNFEHIELIMISSIKYGWTLVSIHSMATDNRATTWNNLITCISAICDLKNMQGQLIDIAEPINRYFNEKIQPAPPKQDPSLEYEVDCVFPGCRRGFLKNIPLGPRGVKRTLVCPMCLGNGRIHVQLDEE